MIRNIIGSVIKAYDSHISDSDRKSIKFSQRQLTEENSEYNHTNECISSYVASELKILQNK